MEKKSNGDLEKDVMAHLSGTGLGKDQLASISKTIADSKASGLKFVDWWILGIPAFERIILQAHVPINQADVIGKLIINERFKGIDVWRKGIPKPDIFQVNITIENITGKMPQV